jgi:ketosteroid isomerase-like protein
VKAVEEAFTRSYFRDGKPKQTLDFSQLTVRFLSRDAALVTGHFQLTGGGEPDQAGWFTLIWIRTTAGWRAMHDHSS